MPSPGTLGHTVASLFRTAVSLRSTPVRRLRKPHLREAPARAYPRQPAVLSQPSSLMVETGGNHMGRVSKSPPEGEACVSAEPEGGRRAHGVRDADFAI